MPVRCKGAFRRVYPGFIQLTAFVAMNLERHIKQHVDLAQHIAKGEKEKAETIKTFYDEYFAVMDLPAEFYHRDDPRRIPGTSPAAGQDDLQGRPVNPASISGWG